MPIVATYTIASAILGILFLGETLPTQGYFGLALAAVGGVLIAGADADAPAVASVTSGREGALGVDGGRKE